MKIAEMKLADRFLEQLEVEGRRTRRALELVPDGHETWQPHARSMPLGRLVFTTASIPSWMAMIIRDESLDLQPAGGRRPDPPQLTNQSERVKALEDAMEKARDAFQGARDELLMKPWRLLEAGKLVSESPRYIMLQDTFMHLAHHRGQLTVYLRLLDSTVPAIYGPSADEHAFV